MNTVSEKTNKNTLNKLFKIIYLIHLILSFNAIYNILKIKNITMILTVLLGCAIILFNVSDIKVYIKQKDFLLLILFLVSYITSMILNYKYAFGENIKCLVWLIFQIYIIYMSSLNRTYQEIKNEFKIISLIWIWIISITNFIGCMMFFGKINLIVDSSNGFKRIGFYWSRLWGLYDDPNQGALFSVIAIYFALFLLRILKSKILLWISIIINSMFIVMSDSRTGVLCLAIGGAVYVFFIYFSKKKYTRAFLLAVSVMMGISFVNKPMQEIFSRISNKLDVSIETNEPVVENIDKIEMGREELSKDPSNRRFSIWKSGIELFKERPIIGLGKYSYTPYALEHMPETYIVNNDFQKFTSMHNLIVEILVSQGILGLCIFICCVFYYISYIVRRYAIIIGSKKCSFYLLCFVIVVTNVLAAMMMPTLLYINSPATYIFWLCLGYFMAMLKAESCIKNM